MNTEAQRWGQTAIVFIGSAAATGVFALLGFVLPMFNPGFTWACRIAAAVSSVVFAASGGSIVRWWIVLAKRSPKSG